MLFRNKQQKGQLLFCTFVWLFFFCLSLSGQDNYTGHRLHLFNIQILKDADSYCQIRFNAANTGREDLNISAKRPLPTLVLDYDHTVFDNKLGAYRENIRRAMTVNDLKLQVGKVENCILLQFDKFLPEDTIRNPQIVPKEPQEQVLTESDKNTNPDRANTGSGTADTPVFQERESDCFDFGLDTVKIIKKNKNYLTLEYVLRNKGSTGAPMLGKTSAESDNLSIRVFISGVPKMTKGALVFGGTFIENMPKGEDGKIPPGKRFSGTFKVDIREKSRYMNYLIFSIDPFQTVRECDERNNIFVLNIEDI